MPVVYSGPFGVMMPGLQSPEKAAGSVFDQFRAQQEMKLRQSDARSLVEVRHQQIMTDKVKAAGNIALMDPEAAERYVANDPVLKSALGSVKVRRAGNFTEVTTEGGTKIIHDGKTWKIVQPQRGLVANTAEGVYLVNPTASKTPRRLGGLPPRSAGQSPATGDKAIMRIRNTIADNARVQAAQETRQRYSDTTFTLTPTGDVAFGQARPEAYDYFMQRVHEIEQQNLEGLTPEIRSRVAAGLSPGPAEETTYVSRELYNYMLEKWSPEEIAAQGIEVSPGE